MVRKLNEQDRAAIDLVLDRFASVGREDGVIAMTGNPVEAHVQSVEQILSVLAQLPAQDPPSDLVDRTLRQIEQVHAAQPRQIPPYHGPEQLPA